MTSSKKWRQKWRHHGDADFFWKFLPYLITMPSYISNIPFFEKLRRGGRNGPPPDVGAIFDPGADRVK